MLKCNNAARVFVKTFERGYAVSDGITCSQFISTNAGRSLGQMAAYKRSEESAENA